MDAGGSRAADGDTVPGQHWRLTLDRMDPFLRTSGGFSRFPHCPALGSARGKVWERQYPPAASRREGKTGPHRPHGDFIEGPADLEVLSALTKRLTLFAPVYFVSGNHEWSSGAIGELAEVLRNNGVRYLQNEALPFRGTGKVLFCAAWRTPTAGRI
jgi:hypothetical protein